MGRPAAAPRGVQPSSIVDPRLRPAGPQGEAGRQRTAVDADDVRSGGVMADPGRVSPLQRAGQVGRGRRRMVEPELDLPLGAGVTQDDPDRGLLAACGDGGHGREGVPQTGRFGRIWGDRSLDLRSVRPR